MALPDPNRLGQPTVAVAQLHALFQRWFRGEPAPSAMETFEASLDPSFAMVVPTGQRLLRAQLLSHLEASQGQRQSDHVVRTSHERSLQSGTLSDGAAWSLVGYEEWAGPAEAVRGRCSTALLVADPAALAGWRWMHVHETWLPVDTE